MVNIKIQQNYIDIIFDTEFFGLPKKRGKNKKKAKNSRNIRKKNHHY